MHHLLSLHTCLLYTSCGLERCAPGQTWGPGIRDHYLIHLVVSGKGTFEVGGKTFEVVPGDLFFARPSQLIRYSADEQQPWEYSWVGFNGACAHKLAAQLPFTDTAPVHHTQDPEGMRAALTNIYSSRGLEPQNEAAMVGYLYLFISALKMCIRDRSNYDFESAYHAMNSLLARRAEFTALFAMSDVIAFGAIRALVSAGLRVPEDVSAVSYTHLGRPAGQHPQGRHHASGQVPLHRQARHQDGRVLRRG